MNQLYINVNVAFPSTLWIVARLRNHCYRTYYLLQTWCLALASSVEQRFIVVFYCCVLLLRFIFVFR